jgi:hypothetical protein
MDLLQQIAAVADEPVVLDPAELENEYQNTSWLDCPQDERLALTVAGVVNAIEACADVLQDRVPTRAVFYVWHDEQAGQLRCSTTSLPADRLPFGARVVEKPLAKIVEEFLAAPGFVPWDDLMIVDKESDEPQPELAIGVWSRQL